MVIKHSGSSGILEELLGHVEFYQKLLKPYQSQLIKDYPNPHLKQHFLSLNWKIISLGTMALCDHLLKDLNQNVNPKDLVALGLHMLAISTHDDVVDEMPKDRILLSSLVFAGNIATNEGSRLLISQGKTKAADILLKSINTNHFYQQHNIETLWTKKPNSFKEYIDGITHTGTLMRIGLNYALVLAGKVDLQDKTDRYAHYYGMAIQLIDDIREVDEDIANGYWSYPVIEGFPYKKSLDQLFIYIKKDRKTIPQNWSYLHNSLDRLEEVANKIKR